MYNDSLMVFDERKKRYILTRQCALDNNINLTECLNSTGVPNEGNLPEQILDRISMTIYNFVYSTGNMLIKRDLMMSNDEYRPFIMDAMIAQLLYVIANGHLTLTPRVNIQNGHEFSSASMRDAAIAPDAQMILEQTDLLYTGFMGRYSCTLPS